MSKKHFIAMANAIRESHEPFSDNQLNVLARFCRQQNNQFNWDRWVSYIRGECGPSGGTVKATR